MTEAEEDGYNFSIVGLGVLGLAIFLLLVYKWRSWRGRPREKEQEQTSASGVASTQLIHRLCPHNNVVQGIEVEQKDSLDEHLDLLTRKLAEKEGRLRLSKSRIRETQNEIDSLHAIDMDVKVKYREIMKSLKNDLMSNEKECKKLQEQIEWVSRRRAELKDEVSRSRRIYGEAAAELASNLSELQRGRADHSIIDKPFEHSSPCVRHRKEPQLPRSSPAASLLIKSPPASPPVTTRYGVQNNK